MRSPAMEAISAAVAANGLAVVRFEFAYMAARAAGKRRPPPRAERLVGEYRAAVEALDDRPLFIGGKSMGGRVASLLADDLFAADRIAGLVCVGYPFHPPGRPETLRTAHLEALRCPALIAQGTRDPFGGREEVAGYRLSPAIELAWFEDGDHDLKPRKRVTGLSQADHIAALGRRIADWTARRI